VSELVILITGIAYMGFSFASAWSKRRFETLLLMLIAFILITIQAALMGLIGFAILTFFNVLRHSFFLLGERYHWARHIAWGWGFVAISAVLYLATTPITAWWVAIPLVARTVGIIAYSQLDNYKSKHYSLIAIFLWLFYYGFAGLWNAFITDVVKMTIMALSLPRTKRYRDEMSAKAEDGLV
jgi:hypothetical protein